ncbi:RagB/SusD family nutrient uptake outer membrane protein [Myroides sp. DF42-4-2]|uniref:RagB/SusD family nutrient uptake outer membrane protein n=1 Tax=Myroides sp. DF42-4-2 TaxID=2746726 RepID=UPI002574DA71|nr:RagB/SusD family nutrient uptake outer membrane protein [Myroides sp. DF42-4-2]MDM1408224.1 RagB/SusD family nutrient uptake outer membrane protein [Myroides sp. DF42-4-2]
MKKNIYISLLLISILMIQSCEKMIEIDLPTDQINAKNVFKDKRSATAVLTNLYLNLRENSIYTGNSQGIATQLGLYTDELVPVSIPPTADESLLFNNTLNPSSSIFEVFWNTSYSHIYAINSFIIGVTESTGISDEDKATFLAEAYTLRTMYYQGLTQLFGDIPYTISTNYKENASIKKTSHLEVLNYIEQDLLKSLESLSYQDKSSQKYYINKAVVELILAKNYLLQKKYDKAEFYAQLLIDNPLYYLEVDLSQVFKKNAQSTLWQLSNSNSTSATYEARNYIMLVDDWLYKLSPNLLNSFDNNDFRKSNWIAEFSPSAGSYNNKYKNYVNNTDECSILFRIEEAYFILSEALIYQNREKEAIPHLNVIRQRAGLTSLSNNLSKEDTILVMLEESRKEFFLEHARRFFDLKRNNKLSILKESKPNWQDKHALLPYPEKELLINPNLNPQNEY